MSRLRELPRSVWRLLKGPILLYKIGLGHLVGNVVLLLTTTGRKSGLPRVTPLQYEKINGEYFVGAVRGKKADWVRNILADPNVEIRVKDNHYFGIAKQIMRSTQIVDFLNLRLKRHPIMMRIMYRAEGLTFPLTNEKLTHLAKKIVLIKITIQRGES